MAIKIPPITRTQEATDTPFDNSSNGFISTDVQSAIEEVKNAADIKTFSASWSRSGNVPSNSWLQNSTVPSNVTGTLMGMVNAFIERIFVANEGVNTFDIEVYEHNGVAYTLLKTVSIVAQASNYFDMSPPVGVTIGKQLAIKLSTGSAKNPTVAMVLSGTV